MSIDKKIKNKKKTLNKTTHGEESNIFLRDFINQFLAENNFIICNVLEYLIL